MAWRDSVNAGTRQPLTRHTVDGDVIVEDPMRLLAQARAAARVADLTLDEYTLAAVMASENGNASAETIACIGDAELNHAEAKGVSVFQRCTGGTGRFGKQSGPRPVSTRLAPSQRHVLCALALTRTGGSVAFGRGPARGIARGARRYYDVRTQYAMWLKGDRNHCHPLVILERWTYNKPWAGARTVDAQGRAVCKLASKPGAGAGEEWVGPISGVDAWHLMLLRPGTAARDAQYAAARAFIQARISPGRKLVAAAALALAVLVML